MKTTATIFSLIVFGTAILYIWSRPKRQEIDSFWDVVRNPDAMSVLDEFHTEVDDAARSLSGASTKVAQLVDSFVFEAESSRDAWKELRTLAKLGEETYPRALEILRDPALKGRLTKLSETEYSLPEGPINRLCDIFGQDAPPPKEAAGLLAPYLQSESDEIRKSVALVIGSIAAAESLPDLRRALADKDGYVRSFALMGIQRAIRGDRIKESSRGDLYERVASMWPDDTSFEVCDQIPLVLLQLDRARAIRYLLSDELFSVRFDPVWRILEAFNKESVEVPRTQLLAIIADASKEPIEYPMGNVLEEALPLLGAHRHQDDLAMLGRLLDHSHEHVSNGATQALYSFHRFYDRIRDPRDVVEKSGWHALTVAEKHVLAIEQLDAEVNNGGFAQYYFNSSGDLWQDAYNGLAAIGAERRHQLMLATIKSFGKVAPAVDRNTRMTQLSNVVDKKEDPFHEQDNAWYEIKDENLDRLIFKYTMANLDGREKTEPSAEDKSQ